MNVVANKEMNIYFVILHYVTIEDTLACVNSLMKLEKCGNINIVIVDNASPNGTGKILEEKYDKQDNISVILLDENVGFAKGNNAGYRFAKKNGADYIILLNSDTEIRQTNFIDKIVEIYEKSHYDILGPDIIDLEGKQQNPHRDKGFELKDVNRIIRNRTIILLYLKVIEKLGCQNKIKLLTKLENIHANSEQKDIARGIERENVVLQGAVYVFSPSFVQDNMEALYSKTFMYLEEEILYYLSMKKGYRIIYSPEIQVLHKWQGATKATLTPGYAKSRRQTEWTLQSAKILRSLMREH